MEQWNCHPRKDDMIPFLFNENRFSFFVADHLLVGQLCTNLKSDRSLLSCLKVTQCSTSKIEDAPLYNSCTLPIQVMITGPLLAPSKCKSGLFNVPKVMKTKFPATVMVFAVVSNATSHLRSRLESQHQSVPGYNEECGDPLVQSGGRWQTLGVAAGLGAGLQVQREPRLGFRRSATILYPPPPPTWTLWSCFENITNMTSHNTKASLIAAIRRVFAELPPALVEKTCSQFRIRIEAVIEAEGGYIE